MILNRHIRWSNIVDDSAAEVSTNCTRRTSQFHSSRKIPYSKEKVDSNFDLLESNAIKICQNLRETVRNSNDKGQKDIADHFKPAPKTIIGTITLDNDVRGMCVNTQRIFSVQDSE